MSSTKFGAAICQPAVGALTVLGATIGLFAGMSESPIAAPLLAGLFGLFGAGGIYTLLGKPEDKQLPYARQLALSIGLGAVCISCVLAAFLGVALRQGLVPWPQVTIAKKAEASLYDLSGKLKELPHAQYIKLLILQSELDNLGVPKEENNRLISALTTDAATNRGLHTAYIGNILGYARDVSGWNQNVISDSLASMKKNVDEALQSQKGKPAEVQARNHVETLERLSTSLMAAERSSRGIGASAEKLETTVRAAVQPDVAVMLDIVSRYRQASVHQNELKIATPAWRRSGGAVAFEEVFKPSIKP